MPYVNLPSFSVEYVDNGTSAVTASTQPKVLILGTASAGDTTRTWRVTSQSAAVAEFGSEGTLIKSMYEAMQNNASNIYLRRLPTGTSAVLSGICRDSLFTEGITITTLQEDGDIGERFKIWFDSAAARLAIYDSEEELWIYDSDEVLATDLGLISVAGTIGVTSVDIGSQADPVAMDSVIAHLETASSNADYDTERGIVFVAGTDGTEPSRMELYEAMLEVFQELDFEDLDILIVPPKATVDCPNVTDADYANYALSLTDYPTPDDDRYDVLGRVHIQEVDHKLYFWWDMGINADGTANIFPSIGSATATADADGTAFDAGGADFHEVNFAWMIAKFCHRASTSWSPVMAFVDTERPEGWDRLNVATWIGELPDYSEDEDGSLIVASGDDGDGLLGIKFLAGANGYNSNLKDGGFFDTFSDFYLDDTVVTDSETDLNVDIGRYIVINCRWAIWTNGWVSPTASPRRARPYVGPPSAVIAGLVATLPPNIEPSGRNGRIRGASLNNMKIPAAALDRLAGIRINSIRNEEGIGVIVAGVKTAALPTSQYAKISTMRCVAEHVKAIMEVGREFQGQPMDDLGFLGLQTQIESRMSALIDLGYASDSRIRLTATAAERRLGHATVELQMTPPYCLESLTIRVSISDSASE
jgi:hypothetical protein